MVQGLFQDEVGNRYGKLTVTGRYIPAKTRGTSRGARWACECDCGVSVVVLGSSLRNGNTKSCGCMRGRRAND